MVLLLLISLTAGTLSTRPDITLDPEIWNCHPDAIGDSAYIIKQELKFRDKKIEHYLLLRVRTKEGKQTLDNFEFPPSLDTFSGQIIDRKGTSVPLNKQNLKKKLLFQTRDQTAFSWLLVPPGLTSDCIVEFFWTENTEAGLPDGVYFKRYEVPTPLFCEEKKILMWKAMDKYTKLMFQDELFPLVTRFVWNKCHPSIQFKQHIIGDDFVLHYKDIPKLTKQPYGSVLHDERTGAFQVYKTIPFDDMSTRDFWHQFCSIYIRFQFEHKQILGQHYSTWIKDLRENMPDHSYDGAVFLQNQFKKKIQSIDFLTSDKKQNLPRRLSLPSPGEMDGEFINTMFLQGYASTQYLTFLLLRVMKDCGLHVKLLYARSIYEPPFVPENLSPFSLELRSPFLILTEENGDFYTFAPTFPESPSGYLPPRFTGVKALVIDPGKNWKHWFLDIPRDSWRRHKLINTFKMRMEQGVIIFDQKTQGSGQFDVLFRNRFHGIPVDEQRETVFNEKQKSLPDWKITASNVGNASLPEKKIIVAVKGKKPVSDHEQWHSIVAFPGIDLPLTLPVSWALPRTQPFIFPHNFYQLDKTTFLLPHDYHLKGFPNWSQKNEFGEVSLASHIEGSTVEFRRTIKLKRSISNLDRADQVSQFFAWLRQAENPNFSIERIK